MEDLDDFQPDVWMQDVDLPPSPLSEEEDLLQDFDLDTIIKTLDNNLEYNDLDLMTIVGDWNNLEFNGEFALPISAMPNEKIKNTKQCRELQFDLSFEQEKHTGEVAMLTTAAGPKGKNKIRKRPREADGDGQSKREKRKDKRKKSPVISITGSPPATAAMVTTSLPPGLLQITSPTTPPLHPTMYHIAPLGATFRLSPALFSPSGSHTYLLVSSSSLVPQTPILPLCPVDSAVAPDLMGSSPPGSQSDSASKALAPPTASLRTAKHNYPMSRKPDPMSHCVSEYIIQAKRHMRAISQDIEAGRSMASQYIDVPLVQRQILIGTGKNASKCLEKELVVLGDTERKQSLLASSQVFQNSVETKPKHSVVLLGNAGMGKTTFIKKLCLDWSDGLLPQFDFVFLLDGKTLTLPSEQTYSLQSLLLHLSSSALPDPCPRPQAVFNRVLSAPERVLVIFDGFEAVRDLEGLTQCPAVDSRGQSYSVRQLFSGLLQRRILPGCSLLLSARPQGTVSGLLRRADSLLELPGFCPADIERYVRRYFSGHTLPSSALTPDPVSGLAQTLIPVSTSTQTLDPVSVLPPTLETVLGLSQMLDPDLASAQMLDPGLASAQMLDPGLASAQMLDPGLASAQMLDPDLASAQTLDPGLASAQMLDPVPARVLAELQNHSYLMSVCWNPALCHMVCLLLEHWRGSEPLPSTLTGVCYNVLGLMMKRQCSTPFYNPENTHTQTHTHSPENTHTQAHTHSPENTHTQTHTHSTENTHTQTHTHSTENTHTQTHTHSPENTHTQTHTHSPENTHTQTHTHSPENTHTQTHAPEQTPSQNKPQKHTKTQSQKHTKSPKQGQKTRCKQINKPTQTQMRTRSRTQSTPAEERTGADEDEQDEEDRHFLSELSSVAWDGVKGHTSLLTLNNSISIKQRGLTTGLIHSYWLRGCEGGDSGSDDNILSWSNPFLQSFLGGAYLSISKCVSDRTLISQILPQPRGRRRLHPESLDLAQRFAVGLLFRKKAELRDLAILDDLAFDAVVAKQLAVASHLKNLHNIHNLTPARLLETFHCVYETGEARQLLPNLPDILSFRRVPLFPPDAVVVWTLLEQCRTQKRKFCLWLEDTGLSVSGLRLLTGLNNINSYRACIADTIAMWEELESRGEEELLKGAVSKFTINPFRATQVSHVQHLARLVSLHTQRRLPDSQSDVLEDGIPAVRKLHKLELELGPVNGPLALPKLLELLPSLHSLQHLDLEKSKLGDSGAEGLAEAIRSLSALEILNLSQNHIGDPGMRTLAPALGALPSLHCLSLYSNVISDEGAESLAAVLPQITTLSDIDVKYNKFTMVGAHSLASSLRKCSWVKSLGLWNQCIPYGVLERLREHDTRIQLL
ncbi:hypothetical protein UPYG_G00094690 [Umbra pygmaea]|uniref:NACHT domain-containing protein n=1 Tax=Umbra pygmaea TaxID=75934 RepID=A0ABD0X3K9_UMBPY